MKKIKSLLNKMSSPMRPPAGLGDLRLIKSFVSKVFSFFITTQSAEDSRQRRSGMTALLDVKAFTLVELLVVVLIIGILSAIAIPMYQGAVDKSHWSTMLPASKAIKDAEEAFKMTNGEYSNTMEHLDVQMNNSDLTFTLNTPNNLSQPNVVRVTNSKLDNVRLASYLDDSPLFAGQLHCEAKNEGSTPNERGQRLCEKLLNGQYLRTTGDGYTRYLLDQAIDKSTCDQSDGFFGQKTSTCYNSNGERCTGLGMNYNEGTQFCGYARYDAVNKTGLEVAEGGMCYSPQSFHNSCKESTFENGGMCIAVGNNGSCVSSSFTNGAVCITKGANGPSCSDGTFDNSICINYGDYGGCGGSSFSNDSVCYAGANVASIYGCAKATYNDTSCCCGGAACQNKNRCSDTRCAQVEQQVSEIMSQVNAL